MWVLFSFLTAGFETAKDVVSKKAVGDVPVIVSAFGLQFFALLIAGPLVLLTGIPQVHSGFWPAALATIAISSLWPILYMKALQLSPLSVAMPMLAFNPLFTALLSYFFDGTLPSISGWIGILLIGLGLYVLRLDSSVLKRGILSPLLSLRREPGALAMLGLALVWAIGAHNSKVLLVNSSPFFAAFTERVLASLALLVLSLWKVDHPFKQFRLHLKNLVKLGTLEGLVVSAQFMALSTGYTPYVFTIKRSNIMLSTITSKLFFGESMNVTKVVGVGLMFVGVVMLIIS